MIVSVTPAAGTVTTPGRPRADATPSTRPTKALVPVTIEARCTRWKPSMNADQILVGRGTTYGFTLLTLIQVCHASAVHLLHPHWFSRHGGTQDAAILLDGIRRIAHVLAEIQATR